MPSYEARPNVVPTTKNEVDHKVPITYGVCISKVVDLVGGGYATNGGATPSSSDEIAFSEPNL